MCTYIDVVSDFRCMTFEDSSDVTQLLTITKQINRPMKAYYAPVLHRRSLHHERSLFKDPPRAY